MRPIRVIEMIMYIFFIIAAVVILDQITKFVASTLLDPGEIISFIPSILSFRYHENKGAAWGMLADHRWIFMSVSTIAIVAILTFLIIKKKNNPLLLNLSLAFFAGGGIGNMIDRVYLGYVVDFIRFDFIEFPIFNVADSFITIGAILIILYFILDSIHEWKLKNQIINEKRSKQ